MPQIIEDNFPIPEHLHCKITDLLTAAMTHDGADKCSFQVYNEEEGTLYLVGIHGFADSFVKYFYTVKPYDNTSCGRAIRIGSAVMVCDVEQDIEFMPYRSVARSSGFLSVKSIRFTTPIVKKWVLFPLTSKNQNIPGIYVPWIR